MSRRMSGSRALNGSSKNMTSGSHGEGAGQPDPLLHAARQLVRVAVGVALQPDEVDHLAGPRLHAPPCGSPRISRPNATLSMTRRWGSRPKCWKTMLNRRRRSSRSVSGVALTDVLAVEQDLAGGRLDEPGHAADERRLAAAGQAHDDEDLARPDVERDVAQADRRAGLRAELVARQVGVGRADDLVLGRPEDLPEVPDGERRRAVPPSRVGRGASSSVHRSSPSRPVSPSEPARRTGCGVLPDVLRLTVLVETARAKFPADAGLLETAPLRLRQVAVVVVDPDRPVAEPAGDPLRARARRPSRPRRPGRSRVVGRARSPRPRSRTARPSGPGRRPPRARSACRAGHRRRPSVGRRSRPGARARRVGGRRPPAARPRRWRRRRAPRPWPDAPRR